MKVARPLCRLCVLLVSVAVPGAALAAETGSKPAPKFQNIRADDSQETREAALYYTPLQLNDASSLSVGGQVRVRGEYWENWNFAEQNDDEFLLTRIRLHTDLRVCQGFRLYVEGISAIAYDRDLPPKGGKRPIDHDALDLLNAFGDITVGDSTLRAGRQEMSYGRQRLISPLDWVNTRRTFDGARVLNKLGDWQADLFVTRLVQVQKYEFNDGDSGQDFYGAYATRKVEGTQGALDLYLLGLDKEVASFGGVLDEEERYTAGSRLSGKALDRAVDYDAEGGYQFGEFGDADISAFFVALEAGYSAPECPMNSRIFLGFDYASGDDDPEDDELGTFNQLYPLGHAYLGGIDVIGRQNVVDYSGGVSCDLPLSNRPKIRAELHHFFRAETADALYDAGGNSLQLEDGSHEIGRELDLVLTYPLCDWSQLWLGYSHFFGEDFVEDAGGEDIDFGYVTLQMTL